MKIRFCVITSEKHSDRMEIVRRGWASHAGAHEVIAISDAQVGSDNYESAIDKTIFALAMPVDFDWLIIIDDDGYPVIKRLELCLASLNANAMVCAGYSHIHIMLGPEKIPAIHGGPGICISHALAVAFKDRIEHGEMVRHHRNSDATISINLHLMGIKPTALPGFHTGIPYPDQIWNFVSCHRVIPHPEHIKFLPVLEAQQ